MKLIYAHSTYKTIDAVAASLDHQIDDLPFAESVANLDELIDLFAEHDEPKKVVEEDQILGIITRRRLRRSIPGKESVSDPTK